MKAGGNGSSHRISIILFLLFLLSYQLTVDSTESLELGMISNFSHLTIANDTNHICVLDRAQPMRNDQNGPSFAHGIQCFLDDLFRLGIQCRRSFIQNLHY